MSTSERVVVIVISVAALAACASLQPAPGKPPAFGAAVSAEEVARWDISIPPAPLGGMLMSQRATSSALTAAPNAGGLPGAGCKLAQAASAATDITMTTTRSDVDIFHAPVCAHPPADDGVVV